MSIMKKRISAVLLLLMLLLAVTGCEYSSTVMSSERTTPNGFSMSYKKFNGVKSYDIRTKGNGAVITMDIVSESGTLSVRILDSDDTVVYEANDLVTGSYVIVLPGSGKHVIKMTAEDHSGSFAFNWSK